MGDVEDGCADLLLRAGQGDAIAATELWKRHQFRLRRMVQLRLDRRLRGRLAPSDVLQETYLEFARCLAQYLARPEIPFFLWLRVLTGRKLNTLHRRYLRTKARDVGREIALFQGSWPRASSASLAAQLIGKHTTPSQAVVRAELRLRVQESLETLEPLDREILALRHFEQLTNLETAQVLGISEAAASNRFVRALMRLRKVWLQMPGCGDGP
jgi:RNA polymerase sigma-70 factor (ECF subfamily)